MNRLIGMNQQYHLGLSNREILQMSYGELRRIIDKLILEKKLPDFKHERYPDKT